MTFEVSSRISTRRIKRIAHVLILPAVAAGFVIACDGDDTNAGLGTGATAGAGGGGASSAGTASNVSGTATGGSVATAGSSGNTSVGGVGSAGTSGGTGGDVGGSAVGGTSDTGGTGGTGGTSDTAGTGGTAGSAGTGGTAPSCTVPTSGGVDFSALLLGPKLVEAEAATLSGSAVAATQGSGWSGSGFADMKASEGGMAWLLDVPASGEYVLDWTYTQEAMRDMRLTVDCTQVVESVAFANTGNWYTAWTTGGAQKVMLTKGTNTIVLETKGNSGANFDTMVVSPPICELTDDAATTCEAERTLMSGFAGLASAGSGWTGLGFADMNGDEGAVNWVLDAPDAGTYTLTFVYAQSAARDMRLMVNGVAVAASLPFKNTGSWNTNWASDVTYDVTLKQGINSVQLATNGGSGPNFDSVMVKDQSDGAGGAGGAGGGGGAGGAP